MDAQAATDGSAPSYRATYQRDIRPVLTQQCLACHVQGGVGPFALDSWQAVKPYAALVVNAVETGRMPPWPASAACRPQRDALRVSPEQRERFRVWRDEGFPEGDPADYQVPVAPARLDVASANRVLDPGASYVADISAPDEYRCFLLPGEFDVDTYITALDIVPGVREQVHHVVVYQIPAAGVARATSNDQASAGMGYQCFGGVDVPQSQNLFSWRPGTMPMTFATGDAVYVAKSSRLMVQMHYNTQYVPPGTTPLPDLTKVALWTLPAGALPERVVARAQAIALFDIPAGAENVTTSANTALSSLSAYGDNGFLRSPTYVAGEIIGMTPHMHRLGTKISASIVRASGESECLVDVPSWAFEWQLDYLFSTPLAYARGDQVRLSCSFDNSLANQPVINGQPVQPRRVVWGEGSLDEMCLSHVWFRYPREAFLAAVR